MDEQKRKKRNLLFYPIGTIGRDAIYQLFANFIMTYILFTRQLNTAQIGAITVIMVVARIFDGLNDPIMGNIIESTRTKWGKFKPWLLIGILSTSAVVIFIFNTHLQGWSFIIAFGIIYFLYSITYTMHDISFWGMIPSLSEDADSRNQFTSRATLFAGIGGTLASVLIPALTAGAGAIGGSSQTAYGIIAIIIGILSPIFMLSILLGVKENRDYEKEPAPKVSFKKIIDTFRKNDQLLWIAIIFLIQQIGNGIVLGGIGSTYIYFDFGYEGGLYSIFSTIGMAATAVLMVIYPMISRKINRKPLMKIMVIVACVGYAMMLLAGIFLKATGSMDIKFWMMTIGYMLSNFGQYCFYLVLMISIFNTVEYNELKHGIRDEGIITSLRPFITKVASALIIVVTNVSYIIFRVTDFTNKIADFEQAASAGTITEEVKKLSISEVLQNVTHGQTLGLVIFMSVVPCVFLLISYFLYQKKYKLDEAEYDRIVKELESRKQ